MSLFGCDALVLVLDAEDARARDNLDAWKAATDHFAIVRRSMRQRLPIVVQVTKLDRAHAKMNVEVAMGAPRVETNPSTGEGIAELARVIERTVLDAFTRARAEGRATTVPEPQVRRARRGPGGGRRHRHGHPRRGALGVRAGHEADGAPSRAGFAKMSSLASLESAFFTYWNEALGSDVDAFGARSSDGAFRSSVATWPRRSSPAAGSRTVRTTRR